MRNLALFALIAASLSAHAKTLKVVATTADLASIVQAIGGSRVSVTSIVTGARDPHRIEAKPSFMSRAAGADLWVAIGLDLEAAYEQAILEGSRNSKIQPGRPGHAYVSEWCRVLDKPVGRVTRAMGDIHPYGNPHVMLDPYNGRAVAVKLAERMGKLDPANASEYKDRVEAFVDRLDRAMFGPALVEKLGGPKLWQWSTAGDLSDELRRAGALGSLGGWAGKMERLRGRPIVTYHRSWVYFASRFGLRIVAELEPKPGIDPTPGHVASVIRTVEQHGVRAIVQERYFSTRNANFVAQRTGAKVVVVPSSVGHEAAASDYIAMFDTIVTRISSAMGG